MDVIIHAYGIIGDGGCHGIIENDVVLNYDSRSGTATVCGKDIEEVKLFDVLPYSIGSAKLYPRVVKTYDGKFVFISHDGVIIATGDSFEDAVKSYNYAVTNNGSCSAYYVCIVDDKGAYGKRHIDHDVITLVDPTIVASRVVSDNSNKHYVKDRLVGRLPNGLFKIEIDPNICARIVECGRCFTCGHDEVFFVPYGRGECMMKCVYCGHKTRLLFDHIDAFANEFLSHRKDATIVIREIKEFKS